MSTQESRGSTSLRDRKVARVVDRDIGPVWHDRFARLIIRNLPQRSGLFALDIHCGSGRLTSELLMRTDETSRVLAIEPDNALLALAKTRVKPAWKKRVYHKPGNFDDIMTMGDETYDVTIANLVLSEAHDLQNALSEMMRITKPGGDVFATLPLAGTWDEVEDIFTEVLRDAGLRGATRRLERFRALRQKPRILAEILRSVGVNDDDFVIEHERLEVLFPSGREFLFAPVIEHGPLRLWKAIIGDDGSPPELFWKLKEAIDTYYLGHVLSVTVIAGLIHVRKPDPTSDAPGLATEFWAHYPELDAIWGGKASASRSGAVSSLFSDADVDDFELDIDFDDDFEPEPAPITPVAPVADIPEPAGGGSGMISVPDVTGARPVVNAAIRDDDDSDNDSDGDNGNSDAASAGSPAQADDPLDFEDRPTTAHTVVRPETNEPETAAHIAVSAEDFVTAPRPAVDSGPSPAGTPDDPLAGAFLDDEEPNPAPAPEPAIQRLQDSQQRHPSEPLSRKHPRSGPVTTAFQAVFVDNNEEKKGSAEPEPAPASKAKIPRGGLKITGSFSSLTTGRYKPVGGADSPAFRAPPKPKSNPEPAASSDDVELMDDLEMEIEVAEVEPEPARPRPKPRRGGPPPRRPPPPPPRGGGRSSGKKPK